MNFLILQDDKCININNIESIDKYKTKQSIIHMVDSNKDISDKDSYILDMSITDLMASLNNCGVQFSRFYKE